MGNPKLTYQYVKDFVEGPEGNGCKLISREYSNSGNLLEFQCACGKPFQTTLESFKYKMKRQCNDCGKKIRDNKNSFCSEYSKSLEYVAPHIAKELDNVKNIAKGMGFIDPKTTYAKSNIDSWWIDKYNNSWKVSINNRIMKNSGYTKLSNKVSKSERIIHNELKLMDENAKLSYKDFGFEIDIFLPKFNLAIEYDGSYHHSEEDTIRRDKDKNKKINKLNIIFVRIREKGLKRLTKNDLILSHKSLIKPKDMKDIVYHLYQVTGCEQFLKMYYKYEEGKFLNPDQPILTNNLISTPLTDGELEFVKSIWDYSKNKSIPEMYSRGSQDKVWYICPCCKKRCESKFQDLFKIPAKRIRTCTHSKISSGDSFGKLTVIGDLGITNGRHFYNCRCECGKEKMIVGASLTQGASKSCGCSRGKGV